MTIPMPPLPAPGHKPAGYVTGLFTADQMRAYGDARYAAGVAAERERIAQWLDGQGQPGYATNIRYMGKP